MKKVRFIIFLLLVPFAIFLSSCNNDIPEEFLLELDPTSSPNAYSADDPFGEIDYFLLTLNKVDLDEVVTEQTAGVLSTVSYGTPIFVNERLNKGDVMRLENLEPGYYSLYVQMVGVYPPYYTVHGYVTVKSNNSITVYDPNGNLTEYIVIEPDVQTIIKFVTTFTEP